MRNFVAKNDFNKGSVHRDRKNDYTRQWDLEEELDYEDSFDESHKSYSDTEDKV